MLYQNVNGLRSKLSSIKSLFPACPYDVVVFCETNLISEISDEELGLSNYNIYRRDRNEESSSKASGGGVLVGVNKELRSWVIPTSVTQIECIFVAIGCFNYSVIVSGVYLPPNYPPAKYAAFCDAVEEAFATSKSHKEVIIVGDFNLPNTDWSNMRMGDEFSLSSHYIFDLASAMSLHQYNTTRNERGVVLDLVLSSLYSVDVQPATDVVIPEDRHHPALEINFEMLSSTSSAKDGFWRPDLRKCNLENVFSLIQNIPLPQPNFEDVEAAFANFCKYLEEIVIENSPLMYVGSSPFPRWFSKELKQLVINKKIAHRIYKRTRRHEDYIRFSGLRRTCCLLAKQCHSAYISKLNETIPDNIKVFWSHVKNQRKNTGLPSRMYLDDVVTHDPSEMCSLFARFFASVYRLPQRPPGTYEIQCNSNLASCYVSCVEMEKKLEALDPNKGPGPDSIPPKLLKYCSAVISPHLTIFFNHLMLRGIFPQNLKFGYITPIHKSGERGDIKNYRPVVIQSCLAKIFESIVLDLLSFSYKSTIVAEQHGFFPGRSTVTNLTVFQNQIIRSFAVNKQVDAVYLDFAKAFDRISHVHLIRKLEAFGIKGNLLQWFVSYLADRHLIVRFGGTLSDSFPALSGVPQGSLLGPALFSLFINDIGDNLSTKFLLFADDAKIFTEVTCLEGCRRLQADLNNLVLWCAANDMDLNPNKCFVMSYTRSHSQFEFDYHIARTPLKRISKVKDLGVVMVPNLDPSDHLLHISKQASASLGFVMRASRDGFSASALRHLYISLVRPHLEYASVTWAPYQRNHCELLERIQHRFLKLIGVRLGFNYTDVPMKDLQKDLGLPLLETRRKILDLMFLWKLLNGGIDCSALLSLLDFRIPRNTRSQELFGRNLVYRLYSYHSVVPRLLRSGNEVAAEVDFFASSLAGFRRQISSALTVDNI